MSTIIRHFCKNEVAASFSQPFRIARTPDSVSPSIPRPPGDRSLPPNIKEDNTIRVCFTCSDVIKAIARN